MKNKITHIGIDYYNKPHSFGQIWVHRNDGTCFDYPINSLTRYRRAVRLLNAFVERNMK